MGGETTTTQNVKSDPWAPAQPALKTALKGALNAYNTTYQGPQVAGMDPNVIAGQNAILGNAGAGTIGNLAGMGANNLGNYLNAGGLNGIQWGATAGMADAAGAFNANSGAAMGALNPYMTGQMRGANPYLDASIDNAMTGASDAVNRQFSAAGRYGSGAHTGALANTLGRIATDARMNAYNADTQNQLNAINSYGQMAGNNLSGNLAALGSIGGMGQQGFQNTLAGVGGLQTLDQAQNIDASNAMSVGGQRMDYQQRLIDAANEAPWARVGNLAQIAGGIGALGGTQNGTTTQTQSGGLPVLGAIAGGLGAFANLYKMSDERTKENIKPVGKLDNGLTVHAYNYKGDSQPQIGLLAQEVEKKIPEAVKEFGGVKHVNYGAAVARAITKRSAA